MSHLWSKARAWFAGDMAPTAGLALTRESTVLAMPHIDESGAAEPIARQVALGFRLFEANSPPDAGKRLATALLALRQGLPTGMLPVQVSLPDPAVSLKLFELEAWPARHAEREALIRWRFAKALALDGLQLACTWASLGRNESKHLVLATAMDRQRLDTISSACREADFLPLTVDLNANYYFNGFYNRWVPGEDGALLIVEPESTALLLWDGERRPCFLRARWKAPSTSAEYDSILADTEWQVRAYVHAAPERRIARVLIAGGEREAFMNHLGSNPKFPCALVDTAMHSNSQKFPLPPLQGEASAASLAGLAR
ncbi:MAG: hypothetical protein OEV31_03175 [Gammaproteobacteria bacterium]|nr:hypothetical protein [Gammaproteobacteria bacterium]